MPHSWCTADQWLSQDGNWGWAEKEKEEGCERNWGGRDRKGEKKEREGIMRC